MLYWRNQREKLVVFAISRLLASRESGNFFSCLHCEMDRLVTFQSKKEEAKNADKRTFKTKAWWLLYSTLTLRASIYSQVAIIKRLSAPPTFLLEYFRFICFSIPLIQKDLSLKRFEYDRFFFGWLITCFPPTSIKVKVCVTNYSQSEAMVAVIN